MKQVMTEQEKIIDIVEEYLEWHAGSPEQFNLYRPILGKLTSNEELTDQERALIDHRLKGFNQ